MGPVKPRIETVKLLGKDHYIPVVRLRNEGDPLHVTEVLRRCQRDPHAISRVGAVSDEVLPVDVCHAWILDAELFVRRKRAVPSGGQKGLRMSGEVESVVAARQTNDRTPRAEVGSEQHDVFVLMLHYRGVVNRFYRVGDLGLGEDGVVRVSSDNVRLHDRLVASKSKTLL
jgi:hypothetical protein